MHVILVSDNSEHLSFQTPLVTALRTYWGVRGLAAHMISFKRPAREAALAAQYILSSSCGETDENPPDTLVSAIWHHCHISKWVDRAIHQSNEDTAAWRENDLTHVVIISDVRAEEYPFLREKVGPHMPVFMSKLTLPSPGDEDVSRFEECVNNSVKAIAKEFSDRMTAGFTAR